MRKLLHNLEEGDVVRINGEQVWVQRIMTYHNALRKGIIFSSDKEIVLTPADVTLYHADFDEGHARELELESIERVEPTLKEWKGRHP